MSILALSSRFAPMGIFCLASIVWFIIVGIAYKSGWVGGGCICFLLFLVALFATADHRATPYSKPQHFIANKGQTKFLNMEKVSKGAKGHIWIHYDHLNIQDPYREVFIPRDEFTPGYARAIMNSTGEPPSEENDDYYYPLIVIDKYAVPKEHGGEWGIPQWVYHPASSIYVFGIGMLPVLGAAKMIKS